MRKAFRPFLAAALVVVGSSQISLAQDVVPKLTGAERAGLNRMREEEKLAHDVYARLAAKWDIGPFSNIGAAEERHASAVSGLLERYAIDDPTEGKGPGEFSDPELSGLFTALVARGELSATEAVRVGLEIEELDIHDLEGLLVQTADPQIQRVYSNLLHGSENHFRAFHRWLTRERGEWQPKHLSEGRVASILAENQQPRHGASQRRDGHGAGVPKGGDAGAGCAGDRPCGAKGGTAKDCGHGGCAKGCAEGGCADCGAAHGSTAGADCPCGAARSGTDDNAH